MSENQQPAISGFINLHKPADWTSHDCVARLRRLLNTKKIGHGGTLDPKATGVLPVAVGKATRLLQYLPVNKAYRAVVRFGVTTTTDDLEGEVASQQSASHLSEAQVAELLPQFLGAIAQTPPIYSAIQVEGKRLYSLARQGKAVAVPSRQVTIHSLKILDWQSGDRPELTLEVSCGPGTYIRSLARDLGATAGTGATLSGLVRTHSSGFELSESITLEALAAALEAGMFEPLAAGLAMQHLRAIALPPDLARRWRMGQKLPLSAQMSGQGLAASEPVSASSPSIPLRILEAKTLEFLGIGEIAIGIPTVADPADSQSESVAQKVLTCKRVYLSYEGPGSGSVTQVHSAQRNAT